MGFKKPFHAVPIKVGAHYRRKLAHDSRHGTVAASVSPNIQSSRLSRPRAAQKRGTSAGMILAAATLVGAGIGIGSTSTGWETVAMALKPVAVSAGLMRARAPQHGDYWSRCDDARAAGTAPIYFGEPGYREGLDGDGDSVACEPYRGM